MEPSTSPASAIPRLDLTKDPEALKQGSEQWKLAMEEIKEALDTHGYFLVKYDAISNDDKERLYEAMRGFFSLPVETKSRGSNYDEAFPAYLGKSSFLPLYETIRVPNAAQKENSEAFTRLMWPNGNDEFCNAMHAMGSKMTDLTRVLTNMILDAYGLGKYQETFTDGSDPVFHMIKYSTPEKEGEAIGISPHADTGYLTVLGQNDVSGLAIKNNQGDWVEVDPGQDYFVVVVAQSLRALTNGRLRPTYHQVNIRGVTERLSYAVFLMPKPDQILDALPEMVDEEHPRLFKPFAFREFAILNRRCAGDPLSSFAGI